MAPDPKKKDPRKQLLKPLVASKGFQGVQGVHPVMRSATQAKAPGVISPTAEGKWAAGSAPRGRPVSNLGQYLIKPTADSPTGFEMLNDTPDLLKSVQDRYLKAFQLPPSLQPKYLRKPEVMDKQRAQAISKGFRNPEEPAAMSLSGHQFGEMTRRLKDEGGFTYDPRQKNFVTEGYSVAAHESAELRVSGGATEAHLAGYVAGSAPTWSAGAQAPRPKGGSSAGRGKEMIGGWRSDTADVLDIPKVFPATPAGHAKSRHAQVLRHQEASFSLHEGAEESNPWHPSTGRLSKQFPEFAHMADKNPRLALEQPEISHWADAPTRKFKRRQS